MRSPKFYNSSLNLVKIAYKTMFLEILFQETNYTYKTLINIYTIYFQLLKHVAPLKLIVNKDS